MVPAAWIADTLDGGPDSREAFAASPDDTRMPGGMYRNQVWFPYPGSNVVLCQGMCGQMIYVNRAADTDRWLRGMSRLQQRIEEGTG